MLLTTYTPNDDSKCVVDLIDYHVNVLAQFQDIVEKIGGKGNFVGCLSVRMNLGEFPVICLGRYEAIFKRVYIHQEYVDSQKEMSDCSKK